MSSYTARSILNHYHVFLILLVTTCLKDVGALRMTLEDLQNVYTNSSPGQQVCYYHGSICIRGQQYCSVEEKTCRSLFPKNASEETKLALCEKILLKNQTEPGVHDTCIYFLGDMERRKGIGHHNEDHPPRSSPLLPVTGKELCPFPEKYCQRGQEFCNITSGDCEPLFPPGFSDSQKRQRCEEVIQTNVTTLWDACIYALGILRCSEINVTDQKAENETQEIVFDIKVTVAVTLAVTLALIFAAIGVAGYCIRDKKLLCFRETVTPSNDGAVRQNLVDPSQQNSSASPQSGSQSEPDNSKTEEGAMKATILPLPNDGAERQNLVDLSQQNSSASPQSGSQGEHDISKTEKGAMKSLDSESDGDLD